MYQKVNIDTCMSMLIIKIYAELSLYSDLWPSSISFINNGSTIIINYMDSVIEGTTVTFGCLPDHVLIGPNSTTCMGNGEWEPEPREVECKGTSPISMFSWVQICRVVVVGDGCMECISIMRHNVLLEV